VQHSKIALPMSPSGQSRKSFGRTDTSALHQKPEISLSIDHIVGLGEHGWQEGWTGRLRGLAVGNELDLLNWQVGGDFVLL